MMRGSRRSNPSWRDATRKGRRRREREAKKAKKAAAQRSKGRRATLVSPARPSRGERLACETTVVREASGNSAGRKEARLGLCKSSSRGGKRMPIYKEDGHRKRHAKRPTLSAEERELSRLEKLLKMKKKKLPTAFKDDGLDYVLNMTGHLGESENSSTGESDFEMTSGEEEPVEVATRSSRISKRRERSDESESSREKIESKRRKESNSGFAAVELVRFELSPEENERKFSGQYKEVSSIEMEEEEGESDGYIDDSAEEDNSSVDSVEKGEEDGVEESGGEERCGKIRYCPPHMRGHEKSLQRTPAVERLRRTLQGLVNRLNDSNVQSICTQLEGMYSNHSRNDMNSCLTEVLVKACVSPALLSERFAMLHAMVVAILHRNVGSEIGAYVIQVLAQKFHHLLSLSPGYGRGKECDCVLMLIGHLYNFKVVHCVLIYDIIRKLVESFTERDVELLLLLLKNTGMEIRRDDATSLKDIILQIQSKAVTSTLRDSSRARFMLETINALKTNNSRKIPNYDPSLLEHMRRLLRGLVRSKGPADENQLKISLSDLLLADQQGRWWVVGSAWTGRESSSTAAGPPGDIKTTESWVLELARKQRMNTDIRRNIFCILMTSEDCADAFEKLLRRSLKDKQQREIVHVLVDCCLQEKTFNPFYAFLGQKFCEFNRTHQVTFQYCVWDRLKALSRLSVFSRSNLCQLLVHLVTSQALSLAVLRVVEFTELGEEEVEFYRKLLHTLLMNSTEDACRAVFSRLSVQPHLKPFGDSLLVFMTHHLTPQPPFVSNTPCPLPSSPEQQDLLRTRLQLVKQLMRTPQTII